jgi:hypothetical protein
MHDYRFTTRKLRSRLHVWLGNIPPTVRGFNIVLGQFSQLHHTTFIKTVIKSRMNVNAPILAGHSIGGIELGSDVNSALDELRREGRAINLSIHDRPSIMLHSYEVDEGLITINADAHGIIVSISCQQPYKGVYEHKLHPGMSVAQIKAVTNKQLLTCSALVLNDELGVFFALPSLYEDCDYISEIPEDLVLEEIYVMPRNWRGY